MNIINKIFSNITSNKWIGTMIHARAVELLLLDFQVNYVIHFVRMSEMSSSRINKFSSMC